jgi:hypothetical protein
MPNSQNWSIPYPSLNDAPDGPGQLQALALATDTGLQTVKTSVPLLVHGAGISGSTYTGQTVKLFPGYGSFTVDSNSDTVILALGSFAGLFSCVIIGASTFNVTAAVRMNQGNLVARLWVGASLATPGAGVSLSYLAVGW